MKSRNVSALNPESFNKFGSYHSMVAMDTERLGPPPVAFYRDILKTDFGGKNPAFSVTQIAQRPLVAEKFEYHSYTGEAFMPLDGDVLIHVAPAGKKEPVPYDKIEIFLIPKGTMAVINPGVWHAAPFVKGGEAVHVLTVLPERTYANDCQMVQFPDEEKVQIVLE
nr:ureidoglycolate lyase [uncultured Eisenbergiella sp.]